MFGSFAGRSSVIAAVKAAGGGGGAPAAPAAYSPVFWYDFGDPSTMFKDAGVTPVSVDADAIVQVNDLSGNGNDLTLSAFGTTAVNYKTNYQNGLSAAAFTGGWLEAVLPAYDGPVSIFYVQQMDNATQHCVLNTTDILMFTNSVHYCWIAPGNTNSHPFQAGVTIHSAVPTGDTDSIYTINQADATGTAQSATSSMTGRMTVGGRLTNAYQHSGHIMEMFVLPMIATPTQKLEMETYLNDKWSVY